MIRKGNSMIPILESNYEQLKNSLLNDSPTFVYAVLNKIIPGFVYIEPNNKNTFLIGTHSGIFYVFGDETNNYFNNSLIELYHNRINEKTRFTLFSSSMKWDKAINDLLKNEISKVQRYTFTFNQHNYLKKKVDLPKEFTIKKIDEEILNKSIEFNEDYYTQYWGSVSKFLENGFGYCILHNGDVVSECTSIFRSRQFAEIDIVTKDDFRGKGLALATIQAFIDYCITSHITPRWDCSVDNLASITLGSKLGFTNPKAYSVFVKAK